MIAVPWLTRLALAAVIAGNPPIDAPPRIHPEDPHRLAVGDRLFFPLGHYGASLTATSRDWDRDPRAMNRRLFDLLAEHGLDYSRAWVYWGALPIERSAWNAFTVHPYARTGPGRAIDGEPRFDLDRFEDAHFELIAGSVDDAAERGIVLQLVVFDCWHLLSRDRHPGSGVAYDPLHPANHVGEDGPRTPEQWADPEGPTFERHRRYVRRLVETVGDRPNIVWEACNENSVDFPRFDLAVAELITATERELASRGVRQHLVMPRDLPDHRQVAGQFLPAADRPDVAETLEEMRAALADEQWAWNRPLIVDNDCCRDRGSASLRRRKAWAALSAGAHVSFFLPEVPSDRGLLESRDTRNGLRFFGVVRDFLERSAIDLVGMAPCSVAAGPGWCFGHADGERVVVLPEGGETTLAGLPEPRVACWVDPRSGALLEAGAGPRWLAPNRRDWVLWVRPGEGPCRWRRPVAGDGGASGGG
ncbi:MAG TPA: hypothetical protein VMV46_00675 [Thermoanaerobaculia bacterium]|nr:hypothetical protein [Thermoanaerobaculia bacterium]